MNRPFNILSLAIHLAPARAESAEAAIAALPGVDIVARGDAHRLAVTISDTDDALAIDSVTAIHRLPGVVSASLVYHAMDDAEIEPAVPMASACTCGGHGGCHGAGSENHSHPTDRRA